MDIGLFVPRKRQRLGGDRPRRSSTGAEDRGFESIWVPEHVVLFDDYESRYPYAADGRFPGGGDTGLLEPLTALTYLAAVTNRIRLGSGIPASCHSATPCTRPAGGRPRLPLGRTADFGIGVGWLREEFEAVAVPPARRGADRRVPAGDALALDRRGLVIRRRALHAAGVPHVPQACPATAPTHPRRGRERCGDARSGTARRRLVLVQPAARRASTTHSSGSTQCSPRRAAAAATSSSRCRRTQPRGRGRRGGISARGVDRLVVLCLAFDVDGLRTQLDHLVFTVLEPARLTALPGSVVTMRTSGIAVAALVGAVGYRLVVGGEPDAGHRARPPRPDRWDR